MSLIFGCYRYRLALAIDIFGFHIAFHKKCLSKYWRKCVSFLSCSCWWIDEFVMRWSIQYCYFETLWWQYVGNQKIATTILDECQINAIDQTNAYLTAIIFLYQVYDRFILKRKKNCKLQIYRTYFNKQLKFI